MFGEDDQDEGQPVDEERPAPVHSVTRKPESIICKSSSPGGLTLPVGATAAAPRQICGGERELVLQSDSYSGSGRCLVYVPTGKSCKR